MDDSLIRLETRARRGDASMSPPRSGLVVAAGLAASAVLGLLAASGPTTSQLATAAPQGPALLPAAGACIEATLHHTERSVRPDGKRQVVEYIDWMFRCERKVWLERDRRNAPSEQEPRGGHAENERLPPAHRLARLVEQRGDERAPSLSFALVDHDGRRIIEVEPADYPRAQFDGSFEAAAHVVTTAVREQMQRVTAPDLPEGLQRLEQRGAGRFSTVTWSAPLALPLEVHTGTEDGTRDDRVVVEVRAVQGDTAPWRRIATYRRVSLRDLQH